MNQNRPKQNKWIKIGIISVISIVAIFIVAAIAVRQIYNNNLKPLSGSQEIVVVEVLKGSSVQQIGEKLEKENVIRKSWAFSWYVRTNGYIEDMKAGTYALRPSQSVEDIVGVIAQGEVATDLITIIPGQRLDQVKAAFINGGFDPEEVENALKPENYRNHPALVDKPAKASLEGYLYPETFRKTDDTTAAQIIEQSLDEMQKQLTPAVRSAISKQGLSVYEGIVLASIIEQEVPKDSDRPIVASVFYNRLRSNTMLQSDATAAYGAILNGETPSLTYSSPYNTYENTGLTPTPISNFSKSALLAAANPVKTNYMYFVSGDDGNTYFSEDLDQHNDAVKKYCKELCS